MKNDGYFVYILTNQNRTVLYIGVTNNLRCRIIKHYLQRGQQKHFTGRYNVYYLLYYEVHQYIQNAISREKEIKSWSRAKKMELINSQNPSLEFLNNKLFKSWPPKDLQEKN